MEETDKIHFLAAINLIYKDLKPNRDIKFIIDSSTAIEAFDALKRAFENIKLFNNKTCYE